MSCLFLIVEVVIIVFDPWFNIDSKMFNDFTFWIDSQNIFNLSLLCICGISALIHCLIWLEVWIKHVVIFVRNYFNRFIPRASMLVYKHLCSCISCWQKIILSVVVFIVLYMQFCCHLHCLNLQRYLYQMTKYISLMDAFQENKFSDWNTLMLNSWRCFLALYSRLSNQTSAQRGWLLFLSDWCR